jgi:hypothetical protein
MNSQNEILKVCSGCRCEILLKFYKINRKGEYTKSCINCLERATIRRKETNLKNKKAFICQECDYKCNVKNNLERHIKIVHLKIKDFQCQECEYKCSIKSHLKTHVIQVHLKIKDFKCPKCDYKCANNGNLQRHIRSCTGSINCSKGELMIMNVLKSLDISYEYNTPYIVKSIKFLKWDFIIEIKDKKLFIEYDGRQHFKPVNFGNISDEKALINYNKGVICDNLKNEFCEDNNFKLLRIPYFEKDNIEKLIKEFIKIK